MKIKHFQGYGCVNMKLTGKRPTVYREFSFDDSVEATQYVIHVSGNHEWGLEMSCPSRYDIHRWLGSHFAKGKTEKDLIFFRTANHGYQRVNNVDEECIDYVLVYKK